MAKHQYDALSQKCRHSEKKASPVGMDATLEVHSMHGSFIFVVVALEKRNDTLPRKAARLVRDLL